MNKDALTIGLHELSDHRHLTCQCSSFHQPRTPHGFSAWIFRAEPPKKGVFIGEETNASIHVKYGIFEIVGYNQAGTPLSQCIHIFFVKGQWWEKLSVEKTFTETMTLGDGWNPVACSSWYFVISSYSWWKKSGDHHLGCIKPRK